MTKILSKCGGLAIQSHESLFCETTNKVGAHGNAASEILTARNSEWPLLQLQSHKQPRIDEEKHEVTYKVSERRWL